MTNPSTPASWGIQLSKLWIASGQQFPVDVKLLALEISKQRFNDPIVKIVAHGISGIDGMLSKLKAGNWCISYDENVTSPGRINFTLAHELGHYLCHRQQHTQFQCGQTDMLDYYSEASRKMEKEANIFASYLLMPASDFRQQISGQPLTLTLLGKVANRYQTSFTATTLKWLEITDEAAMLVVARDDFVCWSYPSKQARFTKAYLPPSTPVPQSAIHRLKTSSHHSGSNWVRVPAGVWHPSLEAEESVVVSDQFELTIFLVRYPDACPIQHEDDIQKDAFDRMADLSKGLGWSK